MTRTAVLRMSRATVALFAALLLALVALLGTGLAGGSDQAGSTWNKSGKPAVEAGSRWSAVTHGATWN